MANKEGMTKEEILEKLESIRSPFAKIKYLQSLEPRAGLMKPSTRKAFYETLGDLSTGLVSFEGQYDIAAESYEKAGLHDKAKEIWKDSGEHSFSNAKSGDNFDEYFEAVNYFKKAGLNKEIDKVINTLEERDFYKAAAECAEIAGMKDKAKKIWKKAGDIESEEKKRPMVSFAKAYYDKAGLKRSNNIEDLKELAENYELLSEGAETSGPLEREYVESAMSIHRRIKNLEKKKGKDNPSLENIVHLVGIGAAFLCSLIFLSGGITGNTIMNYSSKISNIFGSLFFIVGVVVAFFYTQKNK